MPSKSSPDHAPPWLGSPYTLSLRVCERVSECEGGIKCAARRERVESRDQLKHNAVRGDHSGPSETRQWPRRACAVDDIISP